MNLYRCDRLSAVISKEQCRINRTGKPGGPGKMPILACFSCSGCPGLGAAVDINLEVKNMGSPCNFEGCDKFNVVGGFCTVHAKERGLGHLIEAKNTKSRAKGKAKRLASVSTTVAVDKVIAHVKKAAKVQVKEIPDSFGLVENIEKQMVPFGTDPVVVMALREAWAAKEAEWLADISGLSPLKTLARAAQMVEAVEALGY